jgi:hypothetical protein
MKRLILAGALLLSASPALLASAPAGVFRQSDAQEEYDAMNKEFRAARSAFYAKMRELSKAEDTEGLAEAQKDDPSAEFLARFVEAAQQYAGLDGALPFLQWVVENAPVSRTDDGVEVSEEALTAFDTILRDHIGSEKMGAFATGLGRMSRTLGNERCEAALTAIIEKSPYTSVQLDARFSRAQLIMGNNDATDEQREAAAADLEAVIAGSDNERTVGRAESALFELKNLRIGLVAPEIESADLDGIAFKLSDYRGKVVVIDFWGDW